MHKHRLIIPLGAFALGTSSIPSLSQMSLPIWSFEGGGVESYKTQKEIVEVPKNLGLNNENIQHLRDKDYLGATAPKLEVKVIDNSDSSTFKNQLKIEKSSKDISEIHLEVTKETKVNYIDKQSAAKVSELHRKLKKNDHLNFKTALDKVKNFERNNSGISPRSRRSNSNSFQIQKLSEAEKKAISDFFDKFKDLTQEKTTFSTKLNQAAGVNESSQSTTSVCLSCIPGNLKTMGWTGRDMNIFHKKSKVTHSRINKYQYYSDNSPFSREVAKSTWGTWSSLNHPYRNFFNTERDWLNSVEAISDIWKAYYGKVNSWGRRACSVTSFVLPIGNLCSFSKNELEKKLEDANASLELKIGTKLMSIMQRFND